MPAPWTLAWAVTAAGWDALRVASRERTLDLPELVAHLRQGRRWPRWLADPRTCARVVGRLSPLLPPFGMGACMKRSLILLSLWSRCGLTPRLHLGIKPGAGDQRLGHAWVTVDPPVEGVVPSEAGAVEVAVI